MTDLQRLYRHRFDEADLPKKNQIWKVLCDVHLSKYVKSTDTVLDIACGYGEFINNITARRKIAVDVNPDSKDYLDSEVEFYNMPVELLASVVSEKVDVAFTSNFLEHLKSKDDLDVLFASLREIIRPDGVFVVMGPNIRYVYDRYWDFYDHHLPLSHLSLEEGLSQSGFRIEKLIPRFLPYSTRSALPQAPILVSTYLRFPLAWRVFGKQFLVVARNPLN